MGGFLAVCCIALLGVALFGLGFVCYWILDKVKNRPLNILLIVIFFVLFLPAMILLPLVSSTTNKGITPFSFAMRPYSRFMSFIIIVYIALYVWLFNKLGFRLHDIPSWIVYTLMAIIAIAGIIILIVRSVHRSRLIAGKVKPKPKKISHDNNTDPPLIAHVSQPEQQVSHQKSVPPPPPSFVFTDASYDTLSRAFETSIRREYSHFSEKLSDASAKEGHNVLCTRLSEFANFYSNLIITGIVDILAPSSTALPSLWLAANQDVAQKAEALKNLGANRCPFVEGYALLYYVYLGEPCTQDEAEKRLLRFNLYKDAAISNVLGEH